MKQKKGHAECDKYINIQKQNRKEKIKSPNNYKQMKEALHSKGEGQNPHQ